MHVFPNGEESIHSLGDYCECDPLPMVDNYGQITWHHNPLGKPTWTDAEIVEQAELIRAAESVDLWAKAELAGHKKLQVYRFATLDPIKIPGTTNRL